MKLPWRREMSARLEPSIADDGVSYFVSTLLIEGSPNLARTTESIRPIAAYLGQLVNEGLAYINDAEVKIPWAQLYALLGDAEQASSAALLNLPDVGDWAPRLESRRTPSDSEFLVEIAGWQSPRMGSRDLVRMGATVSLKRDRWLLSEAVWRTCTAIEAFAGCSRAQSPDERLRELGKIRALAVSAGATLDDYLERTSIVSPTKLSIDLRRHDVAGVPVIEVVPRPQGAPDGFVDSFDRYDTVRQRYDVVEGDGRLTHVAPSPAVSAALSVVKAMPGRRISSNAARLFGRNPFAVLGDEAREALDEDDLIRARREANILPYRMEFRFGAEGTHPYITLVPLLDTDEEASFPVAHKSATQLLGLAGRSRAAKLPLFHWDGYEIELSLVTEGALTELAAWLTRRSAAEVGITLSEITNLEGYSDRVVGFDARVQTIPYVAKRDANSGWIPENVEAGIMVVDGDTGAAHNVAMSQQAISDLDERVNSALASGATEVALPNSEVRISVARAKEIVKVLREAAISVGRKKAPVSSKDPKNTGSRPSLQILHNIEGLDYSKPVAEIYASKPFSMQVPVALRSDIALLPHQVEGIAWLQHKYERQPEGMSGCLLADDMGLGKTLQSLCLIAWHLERGESDRKPCLIVAPVSLLENWKIEIQKFLDWSDGDVLSLYGDALQRLRLNTSLLEPELLDAGIRKLVRPGFEDGFKVVLTTYETLRDYEFSLARVAWGIVVCDEAQKIKNPAAFVTQAAKALRCDFRIACTGTPVENSLADLWCLFDFFQPGYLGSLNEFTKIFRRDIETRADGHLGLVERLRSATKPWVLRRMKNDVHRGLPAKIEGAKADPSSTALSMSTLQSTLYRESVAAYRAALESREKGSAPILALLARLRMICANPLSVASNDHEARPLADHLSASPKLSWLMLRLAEIRRGGEKAIVFTEFRDIQRLIQRAVADRFAYVPQIINGSTAVDSRSDESRQRLIDRFQSEPGFGVIILSTTAVGFGVNIQAANHVIHFTRPWNPAKEDQATDRAYRIGQTKDVFVYCPTVVGAGYESFEERLGKLLDGKRELSRDMLAGTQEITAEDFIDL